MSEESDLIAASASLTYELARSISILRAAHYQHCTPGNQLAGHDWSDECPLVKAWDERRPRLPTKQEQEA